VLRGAIFCPPTPPLFPPPSGGGGGGDTGKGFSVFFLFGGEWAGGMFTQEEFSVGAIARFFFLFSLYELLAGFLQRLGFFTAGRGAGFHLPGGPPGGFIPPKLGALLPISFGLGLF